jgi:hypothetical protein
MSNNPNLLLMQSVQLELKQQQQQEEADHDLLQHLNSMELAYMVSVRRPIHNIHMHLYQQAGN